MTFLDLRAFPSNTADTPLFIPRLLLEYARVMSLDRDAMSYKPGSNAGDDE